MIKDRSPVYLRIHFFKQLDQDGIHTHIKPHISRNKVSRQLGAEFTGYLAETFGIEELLKIYVNTNPGTDSEDMNGIFASSIDISFDEVLENFATLRMVSEDYQGPFVPCKEEAHTIETGSSSWSLELAMDCGSEDIIGPFYEELELTKPFIYAPIKLVVPTSEEDYKLDIIKSDNWTGELLVRRCGDGEWAEHHYIEGASTHLAELFALNEGEYDVILTRDVGNGVDLYNSANNLYPCELVFYQ